MRPHSNYCTGERGMCLLRTEHVGPCITAASLKGAPMPEKRESLPEVMRGCCGSCVQFGPHYEECTLLHEWAEQNDIETAYLDTPDSLAATCAELDAYRADLVVEAFLEQAEDNDDAVTADMEAQADQEGTDGP